MQITTMLSYSGGFRQSAAQGAEWEQAVFQYGAQIPGT